MSLVFIWWRPRRLICINSRVTSHPSTMPLLGQNSFLHKMHTWRTRFRMKWHLHLKKAFAIFLLSRTTQTYGCQSPLMVLDLIWKEMLWKCLRTITSWLWSKKGDTSQARQAYDNEVSKSDKRHHRALLNGIRFDMPCIDQWTLIIVSNIVCSLFARCMPSFFIKQKY